LCNSFLVRLTLFLEVMTTQLFTGTRRTRYALRVVAQNLRTRRRAADLSQEHLAAKARLKQSAISAYETGRATPDVKTLLRLAVGLDLSVDDLVVGVDEQYDLACHARAVQHSASVAATAGERPIPDREDSSDILRLHQIGERHKDPIKLNHDDHAGDGNGSARAVSFDDSAPTGIGERLARIEAQLADLGSVARLVEDLRAISDAVTDRAAAFATATVDEQSTVARVIAPRSAQSRTAGQPQRQAPRKAR
jgi:transcriptional regulator with XRE-family HTH domain